jgi:hypothetical protein
MEIDLKKSADEIIETFPHEINRLAYYAFTKEWMNDMANTLTVIEKIDENFDHVYLILQDDINENKMYLTFSRYSTSKDEKTETDKINYVSKSTLDEREYFEKVFHEKHKEKYFVSKDGNYKLFVPLKKNGNIIILMFSNARRYGTFSS